MINERLEDIQKFRTYQEWAKIYGMHFQKRLQDENPQRALVGKMVTEQHHTIYLVGEEVDVPRKGLGKLLFGKSEKKLRVLIQLDRNDYYGCFALIRDASLRDSAEKIMAEQDRKSGEKYSSNISYSIKEDFLQWDTISLISVK